MSETGLEFLRSSAAIRAPQYLENVKVFDKAPRADHIVFRATGGIGDLLLSIGVAEQIREKCGPIKIYSKWPEIAAIFTDVPSLHEGLLLNKGFDVILNLGTIGIFQFAKNFDGFRNEAYGQLYIENKNFLSRAPWLHIANYHPFLDNEMGVQAVKEGYTRETLSYASLGLSHKKLFRPIETGRKKPLKRFVTIHDGYDTNHSFKGRATKNLSTKFWEALISKIHDHYKGEVEVCQLGTERSRRFRGVDIDRVGMTTFIQSLRYLSESSCHIDGDSGLVHAAHIIGTKSVVMFGPTPGDFFGYPTNSNLQSHSCSKCWWLTPNWLEKCCLNYETPICMEDFNVENVFDLVRRTVR